MPDVMTYTVCELCQGVCRLRVNGKSETVQCICCRDGGPDGMVPTGVTLRQIDRWAEQERACAGDPTIDPFRRGAILAALERKLKHGLAALARERPRPVAGFGKTDLDPGRPAADTRGSPAGGGK